VKVIEKVKEDCLSSHVQLPQSQVSDTEVGEVDIHKCAGSDRSTRVIDRNLSFYWTGNATFTHFEGQ
jgi:hypothetical protein